MAHKHINPEQYAHQEMSRLLKRVGDYPPPHTHPNQCYCSGSETKKLLSFLGEHQKKLEQLLEKSKSEELSSEEDDFLVEKFEELKTILVGCSYQKREYKSEELRRYTQVASYLTGIFSSLNFLN